MTGRNRRSSTSSSRKHVRMQKCQCTSPQNRASSITGQPQREPRCRAQPSGHLLLQAWGSPQRGLLVCPHFCPVAAPHDREQQFTRQSQKCLQMDSVRLKPPKVFSFFEKIYCSLLHIPYMQQKNKRHFRKKIFVLTYVRANTFTF